MKTINTIGERIKRLRKDLGMTQQEFADRIGVKRNTIAMYDIGRNVPSDAVISLICREFHINEAWLRSGVGEMKTDMTLQQELALAFGDVLASAPDKRSALIAAILAQPPEFFDLMADLAEETVERLRPIWEAEAQKEG